MSSRRRAHAAITIATVAALLPIAAGAQDHPEHGCSGDAGLIGGGGTAVGDCWDGRGGDGALPVVGREGSVPTCVPDSLAIAYFGEPPEDQADRYTRIYTADPPPEGVALLGAYNCDGDYLGGPYQIADTEPVDVGALRDRARAQVIPPLPSPGISPEETVVRFPTWLWVEGDWTTRSATTAQGAVTVRVDARPTTVTWDLVDGTRVCSGPGIPWSRQAEQDYQARPASVRGRGDPACTFEFVDASSTQPDGVYHARVTATWELSWHLNGTAQGSIGAVDRTATFDLRVGEIQSLITR